MEESIGKFSYSHCLGKEASDYKISVDLREKTWPLICQIFSSQHFLLYLTLAGVSCQLWAHLSWTCYESND